MLKEVVGMVDKIADKESINGKEFKIIDVPNRHSFVIACEFNQYTPY